MLLLYLILKLTRIIIIIIKIIMILGGYISGYNVFVIA